MSRVHPLRFLMVGRSTVTLTMTSQQARRVAAAVADAVPVTNADWQQASWLDEASELLFAAADEADDVAGRGATSGSHSWWRWGRRMSVDRGELQREAVTPYTASMADRAHRDSVPPFTSHDDLETVDPRGVRAWRHAMQAKRAAAPKMEPPAASAEDETLGADARHARAAAAASVAVAVSEAAGATKRPVVPPDVGNSASVGDHENRAAPAIPSVAAATVQETRRSALHAAAAARFAATAAARAAARAEKAALAFEHEVSVAPRAPDEGSRPPDLGTGVPDPRDAPLALALRVEAAAHVAEMRAARKETSHVDGSFDAVETARATVDAAIAHDESDSGRPALVADAVAALQCNDGTAANTGGYRVT